MEPEKEQEDRRRCIERPRGCRMALQRIDLVEMVDRPLNQLRIVYSRFHHLIDLLRIDMRIVLIVLDLLLIEKGKEKELDRRSKERGKELDRRPSEKGRGIDLSSIRLRLIDLLLLRLVRDWSTIDRLRVGTEIALLLLAEVETIDVIVMVSSCTL